MNDKDYVRLSLELHLFFDRIMKEHSFFIDIGFTEKDSKYKTIAKNFQIIFADILNRIITLADGNISENILNFDEIVTDNTIKAEDISSKLTGVMIDRNITLKELNLKSGNISVNKNLLNEISNINNQTLLVVQDLISFKEDILSKVLDCEMFTGNYPLLIKHITDEAKMYYELLTKIENKETVDSNYVYEQEMFWNNIMKEHALFIRGLLDPSENELINQANTYARDYNMIMNNYDNSLTNLTNISTKETIQFKNFKTAGLEGILACKIKSIIVPLLGDHVLREANHFLRILKNYSNL